MAPSSPTRPGFGKIAWLIKAVRLFWWTGIHLIDRITRILHAKRRTGIHLIDRITRILHAKRSGFSVNRVTRDERCRSDANEDSAVPDQPETGTTAMIPKDLVLVAVPDRSRSWKWSPGVAPRRGAALSEARHGLPRGAVPPIGARHGEQSRL